MVPDNKIVGGVFARQSGRNFFFVFFFFFVFVLFFCFFFFFFVFFFFFFGFWFGVWVCLWGWLWVGMLCWVLLCCWGWCGFLFVGGVVQWANNIKRRRSTTGSVSSINLVEE